MGHPPKEGQESAGGEGSRLFRRASLDRLSSPEQLDELMQVVGAKSWLSLGTLGVLVALGLAWSIWGRIPVSVEGRGVLIYPRRVVDLQSPLAGTLRTISLTPGQVLSAGEPIAELDRSLLRSQLEQKREELARGKKRREQSASLHSDRIEREREALARERELLARQIAESKEQADSLLAAGKKSLDDRRKGLEEQLAIFRGLSKRLQERVSSYEDLEAKGVVSKQALLQLEQAAMNTLMTCQTLQSQLQELSVSEIQARAQDMERRHRILDLENRLQDLDRKASKQAQDAAEFTATREESIEELELAVRQLEAQLSQQSQVLSPYSGRVLEVTAVHGQVVQVGSRLGALEIEDPGQPLVAVTCFAIGDGKRVREGLALQVTPETVQRERFGGILGTVVEASRFPVSVQEVTQIVGNEDVAKALVPPQGCILVTGELTRDAATESGYAWSSSGGPPLQLTPGTTTSARVVVEQRSPLSFVLPTLRSSTGVE